MDRPYSRVGMCTLECDFPRGKWTVRRKCQRMDQHICNAHTTIARYSRRSFRTHDDSRAMCRTDFPRNRDSRNTLRRHSFRDTRHSVRMVRVGRELVPVPVQSLNFELTKHSIKNTEFTKIDDKLRVERVRCSPPKFVGCGDAPQPKNIGGEVVPFPPRLCVNKSIHVVQTSHQI